jgi:2,4-dienoyl-CoA reductase-like NADH-dependent reductase (Old Yellow Enzyme family)
MRKVVPNVFEPATLGPVRLRNRIIKPATSEGRSPHGLVTDELIAFHRAVADGGVGLTTVAYCTVAPEGFASTGQLLMSPAALPGLRRLAASVHEAGAAVSAQLGHSGPVANHWLTGHRPLAPSWFLNPSSLSAARAVSVAEIAKIVKQFADAAELAASAGFDAVELHFGHLYLVSSFLSPVVNRRKDAYGGSLENRARLAVEIARAVRRRVGRGLAVTAKLSMSDGVWGSIWVDEALQTAKILDADAQLDAIELSQGSSVWRPMLLFTGDVPVSGFVDLFTHQFCPFGWLKRPFRAVATALTPPIIGPVVLGKYPYHDLYMLKHARQFVGELKNTKLILLGGIGNYAHMERAMQEGFDFVAMGRPLIREPDLVRRIQEDKSVATKCIRCNKCMFTVFQKTKCCLNPMYAVIP